MFDYDVALSFAGEDREYVDKVAEILNAIGLKVFYDKHEQVGLWGKNLYVHLDTIYQNSAQYCVMFISKYYKEKLWTNHEREIAQARSFAQNEEYILPARFDDTVIPGIRNTIGYLDLRIFTPEEFAKLIAKKVKPDINIDYMLNYLIESLDGYEIYMKGTMIVFNCEAEEYYSEFPIRLMLEMYKAGELDRMFLIPAIVPW
ncbi:toll/interleukin-1 receptor domain-containing protein [Clostridium tagluense]|uniref:toll/interleukin-1 receptor domain-containing protein n=1 Tax=Clostridium tagluense TaxID=360422 RepID=UPI001C0CA96C|nr:TIR domain-containing protein [Clostridium tagluense]MBU3129005.1 TIR domain-containing protein [Clostridium tagluense]